jgi:division protein CdvB (Snf7/Vps24/ESCRT-III family)
MDTIQNDDTKVNADEVVETTPETVVSEEATPQAKPVTEETPVVEAEKNTEEAN